MLMFDTEAPPRGLLQRSWVCDAAGFMPLKKTGDDDADQEGKKAS